MFQKKFQQELIIIRIVIDIEDTIITLYNSVHTRYIIFIPVKILF